MRGDDRIYKDRYVTAMIPNDPKLAECDALRQRVAHLEGALELYASVDSNDPTAWPGPEPARQALQEQSK